MRLLLDTHAFLWWIDDDSRLSETSRDLIADGKNEIFLSVASAWEMAIKASLGRIGFPDKLGPFLTRQIGENGFEVLAIQLAHALRVHELPHHHKDPFDRLLIATSQAEDMPILSRDEALADYEVEVIW